MIDNFTNDLNGEKANLIILEYKGLIETLKQVEERDNKDEG